MSTYYLQMDWGSWYLWLASINIPKPWHLRLDVSLERSIGKKTKKIMLEKENSRWINYRNRQYQ